MIVFASIKIFRNLRKCFALQNRQQPVDDFQASLMIFSIYS